MSVSTAAAGLGARALGRSVFRLTFGTSEVVRLCPSVTYFCRHKAPHQLRAGRNLPTIGELLVF